MRIFPTQGINYWINKSPVLFSEQFILHFEINYAIFIMFLACWFYLNSVFPSHPDMNCWEFLPPGNALDIFCLFVRNVLWRKATWMEKQVGKKTKEAHIAWILFMEQPVGYCCIINNAHRRSQQSSSVHLEVNNAFSRLGFIHIVAGKSLSWDVGL